MTRPLYSPPRPAPVVARNRRISPRQAEMLESLWNARLRRQARRPRQERSREERLRHIAETVGRSVEHAGELSWREANRVIRRLLDEVRSDGLPLAPADPGSSPAGSGALTALRRRAGKRPSKLSASSSGSARAKSISRSEERGNEGPALPRRGSARLTAKSSRKGRRCSP